MPVVEINNYPTLLGFLYRDEVKFIEEISIIEKMYIHPDIHAYTEKYGETDKFLLLQNRGHGYVSVFLHAGDDAEFAAQAYKIFGKHPKIHLQTGETEKSILKEKLPVASEYGYVLMKFDPARFTPVYEPAPARVNPEISSLDLESFSCGDTDKFREYLRHGTFYGFREDGKWVASCGVMVSSRNYDYLYVNTDPGYRNRGFGRSLVSHVIREIIGSGKQPVYALDPTNEPSMKLARKCGFVPYATRECMLAGKWTLNRCPEDCPSIPDSSFYE